MTNSVKLIADIIPQKASIYGEVMGGFGFSLPPEELRQKDLQYVLAILVSSGMNLNGAVFMPSELIAAKDTMLDKPLDVEHLEGYIVGHIYDRAFMLKDRSVIDPIELLVSKGNKVDSEDIDIAVAMSLYKYRFPDIAQEVLDGKYKVSMECYYKDFDIKVGDIIISKDEAKKLGISFDGEGSFIGSSVKLVDGKKELGYSKIGRVFRDIMFSGCGLVEFPANEESVILEAASDNSAGVVLDKVIDMSASDTYMKNKLEMESVSVPDLSDEGDSTNTPDDNANASSDNPGTCVSYRKYYYVYSPDDSAEFDQENQPPAPTVPGIGDNPGPDDKIVKKNWCTLFDMECTSLDADATHPFCLRNVFNRSTKEVLSNFYDVYIYNNMPVESWEERMNKAEENVKRMKQLIDSIKIK